LIADAQLAATRANGAEVAFTNPGGVRASLRASGRDGTVTYADAYATQPFGNSLVTLTLTGAQLKTLLEQQWSVARPERARILQPSAGFTYQWDGRRPHGSRVEGMRVTINSFLASGGDSFRVLRAGRDRVGGPLDIDAFTEFLSAQSVLRPLSPKSAARIRRTG
jgi:5'-nucleotidase